MNNDTKTKSFVKNEFTEKETKRILHELSQLLIKEALEANMGREVKHIGSKYIFLDAETNKPVLKYRINTTMTDLPINNSFEINEYTVEYYIPTEQ
ncbi:MAG: hypothetical protein IPM95_12030 [Sphingobacteriales bacterium]|nr:hypothetical protein [Sphingobacteriales bacterium]